MQQLVKAKLLENENMMAKITQSEALKLLNCSRAAIKDYIDANIIRFFVAEPQNNNSPVKKRYYTYKFELANFLINLADENFPDNFPSSQRDIILKYNKPANPVFTCRPENQQVIDQEYNIIKSKVINSLSKNKPKR